MGMTYAFGYFFAMPVYLVMTAVVLFFNFFYPKDYTINWLWCLLVLYVFDLLIYTLVLGVV